MAIFVLGVLAFSCGPEQPKHAAEPAGSEAQKKDAEDARERESRRDLPLADAEVEAWRSELLALAFDSASKMPMDPHVKNRARFQHWVVDACCELGLLATAAHYAEQIPNWRSGVALGEVARRAAMEGRSEAARALVARATKVATRIANDPNEQQWRVHRIRAKCASVHLHLGDSKEAAKLSENLSSSEVLQFEPERMAAAAKKTFEEELERIDGLLRAGDLEEIRAGLESALRLFEREYADAGRRAQLESRIRSKKWKLPADLRIRFLLQAGHIAVEGGRPEHARSFLAEANAVREATTWLPEAEVPVRAYLARLRHEVGETKKARQELSDALAAFRIGRKKIADMFRGEALRPVAEIYHEVGDSKQSLATYLDLTEESLENPNSRPRVRDLVMTCCSLATNGIQPSDELHAKLVAIGAGLSSPW